MVPLHILLIEDNAGDLLLLQHLLQASGIPLKTTSKAGSLKEAMEILQVEKPDLIFLDLFLPDSNSIDTFAIINAAVPAVPIVILSGLSNQDVALKAIQSGAQDYLIKGEFDEKLLSKTMAYSVERKKIQERLKKSIERYETISRATSDLVWEWDLLNDVMTCRQEDIEKTFGYPAGANDNQPAWWISCIHPEDRRKVERQIKRAMEQGKIQLASEYRFRCADGSYKYIYDRTYIFYNNEGQPYRMIGAKQDLTELKMLQEKMIRDKIINQQKITEATIQSQERQREELGRELHDNINQILATSKMFIDISLKNPALVPELLPKSFSYLNIAIEEIRKLCSSLVPPSMGDIGLEESIKELLAVSSQAATVKYVFTTNGMEGLEIPQRVMLMMYRIVQEQLNNISKYAGATQTGIHLWQEKGAVRISITDNGVGFDTTRKSKGIGLRNIRSRAEVYGGQMKITSMPGQGCTLQVFIPLRVKENA